MKKITYEISGFSPLLMNSPYGMLRGGDTKSHVKKIPTPEEEAESKCYRLASGQLNVRGIMFRSAIMEASKGYKVGKYFLRTLMGGALFVYSEDLPLHVPGTREPIMTYVIDTQRCVVQKQGVMRSRPRIDQWGCRCTFEFDDEQLITPDHITDTLNRAGKVCGVGDYRPKCPSGNGGPYGRFTAELISVEAMKF